MISTFGTFTVARLGILAASQGLNVTGHNISNINTDNYVRQTLDQFTISVGGADLVHSNNIAKIGNGVLTPSVSHSRDVYLDIRYRNANAKVGELDARVNGLDNLSTILDDVTKGEDGEGILEGMYNEMITQMNSLAAEGAGKDQYDTLFRSSMSAFTHQINKSALDLTNLMATTEGRFKQDLDAANTLIDQIRELNTSIRKNQIYGDRSLEQQDQRDALLDQLSNYMDLDITYEKEEVGYGLELDKLVIHTGTEPPRLLVDGIYAANLTMRKDADDDLGAVNEFGLPVSYSVDGGAVTNRDGAMQQGATPQAFSSMEEAQALADSLTEAADGASVYRPVTDESGVITVHQFTPEYRSLTDEAGSSSSQAMTFKTVEEAKAWADGMNAEYSSRVEYNDTGKTEEDGEANRKKETQIRFNTRYQVKGGEDGEPITVHMYDLNYDMNFTDLVDIHGNSKIVKKIDLGAVKNNDMGAIVDDEGNTTTDPKARVLTFTSVKEAQEKIQELEKKGTADIEYRAMTDDNGIVTIHAFNATVYNKKEDALAALEEMEQDTSEHVNGSGEATHYFYDVKEQAEGSNTWEIRAYDIFRGKVLLGDQEVGGRLLADRELLTEDGYFSTASDLERDPDAASKRGIPFYIHSLDAMANQMATTLNEANQLPDEVIYQANDKGEFLDADGNVTDDPEKYVLREEYSYYNGGTLLSNHPNTNDETYITARNISISKNWGNGSFRVLRSTLPDAPSTANDNLGHIYNLLTKEHTFQTNSEAYNAAASNETYFTGSYQQLITDHISASLASDLRTANVMQANYTTDADELYVNRDGVMGVDLNDEAMMIMKYQKAYSASCRLMTAFDQLLERLINS